MPKKKTYEQRKADGRTCHTVWLSAEATKALDVLMQRLDASKTEVLERLLTREERLMRMLALPTPAAVPVARPAPAAPQSPRPAPRQAEARSLAVPGSPADLARKVLDKGRRGATIVASGKRVSEGREQRR